jgi:hypothetical protein
MMAVNGEGVWKWVAAILVAIMLAGAPSIVQAIKAPSQDEVDLIHERQNLVLQRLAVLESQFQTNQAVLTQLAIDIREHIQTDVPR